MVLPEITYGNYPYGNYVGNAPVGKVHYRRNLPTVMLPLTHKTENALLADLSISLKLPAMASYVLIAVTIVVVDNF